MKPSKNKRSDLINLLLGVAVVILLNVVSQFAFTRFDLTSEKRFTLAGVTENMLDSLDDVVFFRVYLEGDFPQGAGGFKRLRDETRLMLDEFRAIAGDNIQYEFINPSESDEKKKRDAFYKQLVDKGLRPFNLQVPTEDGKTEQIIFPGIIASYKGREFPVTLLSSRKAETPDQQLNNSVEEIEYKLSNAIRVLKIPVRPRVAFIQGHGESDSIHTASLAEALKEYYDIEYVTLNDSISKLRDTLQNATQIRNHYKAIIISSPDSVFSLREQFILDQFVMYGGSVLWLVDPMETNLDSLAINGLTISLPAVRGIEEMLFKYGARLNTDMIQDLTCGPITINISPPGTPARFDQRPWYFYPITIPDTRHPIVKDMNAIRFDYASSVDTIENGGSVRKTVLISSSKNSRTLNAPVRIGLDLSRYKLNERLLNKSYLPMAVLLEGNFDSYFKSKLLPPEIKNNPIIGYKYNSAPAKMIVVGDGSIGENAVMQGRALPLGFDRNSKQEFANKTFLLNCMNYLCGDESMLAVRSREVTLRLLDSKKVSKQRMKWQIINMGAPVALLVIFGVVMFWFRSKRYGKKAV